MQVTMNTCESILLSFIILLFINHSCNYTRLKDGLFSERVTESVSAGVVSEEGIGGTETSAAAAGVSTVVGVGDSDSGARSSKEAGVSSSESSSVTT